MSLNFPFRSFSTRSPLNLTEIDELLSPKTNVIYLTFIGISLDYLL